MSYSKRGEALRLADKANAPSPNSHPNIFICDKNQFSNTYYSTLQ